jgi:hypothetical protein
MTTPLRRLLWAFLAGVGLTRGLSGQAASGLLDPLEHVRSRPDYLSADSISGTPAERAAYAAADFTQKGFPFWIAARTVAGRSFVFVRGWSGEGTGFGQIADFIFEPRSGAPPQLVWSSVAAEQSTPGGPYAKQENPYRIRGCLLLAGTAELAYYIVERRDRDRDDDRVPVPRSGYYAWSDSGSRFKLVRAPDAQLRDACGHAPDLLKQD